MPKYRVVLKAYTELPTGEACEMTWDLGETFDFSKVTRVKDKATIAAMASGLDILPLVQPPDVMDSRLIDVVGLTPELPMPEPEPEPEPVSSNLYKRSAVRDWLRDQLTKAGIETW